MLGVGLSVALMTAAPHSLTLAAPDVTSHNIEQQTAAYYLERFAQKLGGSRIKITTSAEIAAVLGIERQRELMGCGESATSCAAELAQALGVDGVLRGTVAKFGKRIDITVKVLSARDASSMGAISVQADDEAALIDRLDAAALELRAQLLGPPEEVVATAQASSPPRWLPIAAAGGGLVAAAIGAGFLVSSFGAADRLTSAPPNSLPDAEGLAASARVQRGAGIALLAVGAAGIATGALLFLGKREPVQPVVLIAPGGSWIGVAGSLP
ncbi:MAG: hypothetical protein H6Q89_5103 [Myxococcaceae bacterium]|nr:hypothetical protein [Myxococcaceae bacterium]